MRMVLRILVVLLSVQLWAGVEEYQVSGDTTTTISKPTENWQESLPGTQAEKINLCRKLPMLIGFQNSLDEQLRKYDPAAVEQAKAIFLSQQPEYREIITLVFHASELEKSGYCKGVQTAPDTIKSDAQPNQQPQAVSKKRSFWDWLALGLQVAGQAASAAGNTLQQQQQTRSMQNQESVTCSPPIVGGRPVQGVCPSQSNQTPYVSPGRVGAAPPQLIPPFVAGPSWNRLLLYGGKDHSVFIGCMNCSSADPDSVWNPVGKYGSSVSPSSIWNKVGDYGSVVSSTSAWNPVAASPPIIVDSQGNAVGHLTYNPAVP